jgi:hypothetical protein
LRFKIRFFNGELFVEKAVCSMCGNEVHNKVRDSLVPRMFDVANVLGKSYAAALTEADGIQEKHKGEDAVFELYKTAERQLPGKFVFR